jgi:hypothetical protein
MGHVSFVTTFVQLKRQCHEICDFRIFVINHLPPVSCLYRWRVFKRKNREDIRNSECTTGLNATGGKFATGVNYIGGEP